MAKRRKEKQGSPAEGSPAPDGTGGETGERGADGRAAKGRRGPRKPRKVTPDYLERAALHYLERFATSSENLRRVLRRRVLKSARFHGTDPAEAEPWIDALIERYRSSGLLDDRAYAEARAASLFRRGDSLRAMRAKMAAKGVGADEIDAALDGLADELPGRLGDEAEPAPEEIEREAARNYLRRRRLGPHRPAEAREANRERDLAALARAGFGYDVARAALEEDGEDREEGA